MGQNSTEHMLGIAFGDKWFLLSYLIRISVRF